MVARPERRVQHLVQERHRRGGIGVGPGRAPARDPHPAASSTRRWAIMPRTWAA
ncbi:hypothetical protein [Ornithinimicrobium kibberense]|uniref:hypothetical protein n=1 Tax=Ornithinimicrobium kibberense TaxID=282060 RepID=UPI003609BFB7